MRGNHGPVTCTWMRTHTCAHWDCYFFLVQIKIIYHVVYVKANLDFLLLFWFLFCFSAPKPLPEVTTRWLLLQSVHRFVHNQANVFSGFWLAVWGWHLIPLWSCKTLMDPFLSREAKKKGKEKASVVSVDRQLELLGNTGIVWVSVCVCTSH